MATDVQSQSFGPARFSSQPIDLEFLFRGVAIGFAGTVNTPRTHQLGTHGVSALSSIGGLSKAEQGSLETKVFSFGAVASRAEGVEVGGGRRKEFRTSVEAFVKDFTFRGIRGQFEGVPVVQIEGLRSHIESRHSLGRRNRMVTPETNRIELSVLGQRIKTRTRDRLLTAATIEDFEAGWARRDRWLLETSFDGEPEWGNDFAIPRRRGALVYSIFDDVRLADRDEHPDIKIRGNVISVRDFGRIILGEVIRTRESVRLNMARMVLGDMPEWEPERPRRPRWPFGRRARLLSRDDALRLGIHTISSTTSGSTSGGSTSGGSTSGGSTSGGSTSDDSTTGGSTSGGNGGNGGNGANGGNGEEDPPEGDAVVGGVESNGKEL